MGKAHSVRCYNLYISVGIHNLIAETDLHYFRINGAQQLTYTRLFIMIYWANGMCQLF